MKKNNTTPETETGSAKPTYWTRKRVLYWANIIFFILLVILAVFDWTLYDVLRENTLVTISVCIVIQILYTFLTLVIYYLSIVADSLRYRRKDSSEESGQDKK
ncbi:MAG: hypothetical protein LUD50_04420 [Clostridia bacterium]|nr:hypothetical protein [Clostridia bacterium]